MVILVMAITTLLAGCDDSSQISEKKDKKFSRKIGSAEAQSNGAEWVRMTDRGPLFESDTPISDALGFLRLSENDLKRQYAFVEGYMMMARLPLIDQLARSPFILQSWTEETSDRLQQTPPNRLTDTFYIAVSALGSKASPALSNKRSYPDTENLTEAFQYVFNKFEQSLNDKELVKLKNIGFKPEFERYLASLIRSLADSASLTIEAYSELSPDELEYLTVTPERYFFPNGDKFQFLTAPTHTQIKIVSIARKIKFNVLFNAVKCLNAAIDEFILFIERKADKSNLAELFFVDGQKRLGVVLSLPTPIGDIVVLGQGDNIIDSTAALVIDLGGNDHYIGSGEIEGSHLRPLTVHLDLIGDDTYEDAKGGRRQGVGIASINVLADIHGDDHYTAGDMSQGCGIYGVGILLDAQGNDIYEMGLMGQGFGVFGIGIISDQKGSDRYVINGMGQGMGSTMGFGSLIDKSGNDVYKAERFPKRSTLIPDEWSHAQGAGISIRSPNWHRSYSLYGGIGFLSDGAGDDVYRCSAGNCMGAGYFMSVGSLVDHFGNDRYYPENGNSLGFAVHLASGILVDREGGDIYYARTDSGGVGADHSVGMLVDYQGNDLYGPYLSLDSQKLANEDEIGKAVSLENLKRLDNELAVSSYGSASRTKGLGFLIDYSGNDRYFAQRTTRSSSCGAVIPPPEPINWSHAFLIDLGGNDTYFPLNRKNDSFHIDLDHGLFYDIGQNGHVESVADLTNSFNSEYQEKLDLTDIIVPEPLRDDIYQLAGQDSFIRFEHIGRLIRSTPDTISTLIRVLQYSENEEVNLSLVEVLNSFILRRKMNRNRSRQFESLLKARHPNVRIFAARTLGWWAVAGSSNSLIDAIKDPDMTVRSHVIWAIGRLGRIEDLNIIQNEALISKSPHIKRTASQSYIAILKQNAISGEDIQTSVQDTLLKWMCDPDPIVRREAAAGFRYLRVNPVTIEALRSGLLDLNIYVQRASAISLAFLGQKEGLPVLINSLRFPSIDTKAFYDQDIVKDLAYFTGTDFSEDVRYDPKVWEDWYKRNKHEIDVAKNLSIREKIESAFAKDNENDGLLILDRLRAHHPSNQVIKQRTVRFCRDWITYRLLTRESINRDILTRCIRLQKKIVELEPEDPIAFSTLANYYARLGRFEEAIAAMKTASHLDPGNRRFQKVLAYYESFGRTGRPNNKESEIKIRSVEK